MIYSHLRADSLYTGISSGPNPRQRVWEAFTVYLLRLFCEWSKCVKYNIVKRVRTKVAGDADVGGECYEIALLRDGEHSRNIRTCVDRRHSRRRLVYVSSTSSVEVVLLRRTTDRFQGTFILHYIGTPESFSRLF